MRRALLYDLIKFSRWKRNRPNTWNVKVKKPSSFSMNWEVLKIRCCNKNYRNSAPREWDAELPPIAADVNVIHKLYLFNNLMRLQLLWLVSIFFTANCNKLYHNSPPDVGPPSWILLPITININLMWRMRESESDLLQWLQDSFCD